METKYFYSKKLRLVVTKTDNPVDEKPFVITNYTDGSPFKDAGNLIKSFGQRDFWASCIDKQEFDKRLADYEYFHSPECIAKRKLKEIEKEEAERAAAEKAFEELKAKAYPIPATYENIGIVLRWLNTKNWGSWDLPKLTIGYSASQYDCDGRVASALILNTPIMVSGRLTRKLVYGVPGFRYLMKYTRCES